MPLSSYQFESILAKVEKPSRYLGTEVNSIRKEGGDCFRVGLAFPDMYEIGSSHFGLQILYDILNRDETIAAERIYVPAPDMAAMLRETGLPLATLETRTPLGDLQILGFSLLYELNYTGVLEILSLAGLPFYSRDRNEFHPLIIAGGPCVCNPEPMAPFFDVMLMGDGEEQLPALCRRVQDFEKAGGGTRRDLLTKLALIDGVYVPSFYTPSWDEKGLQRLAPEEGQPPSVKKAVLSSLEAAPVPLRPVLPFTNPVHDRLRLEIARGCTRGCRFCQAGMLYRPVRERSVERLLQITEVALAATGYDEMSLLSLSTGDYGCLSDLMEQLMDRYAGEQRAISLPSIRAGRLTPALMEQIKKVRKTGFTIAPEAGSQRLRDVINKNITEEEIVNTVRDAISLGWNQIKLYFMVGLPTETDEDLQGIIDLADKLRRFRTPQGKWGQVTVSVGTFIPKPHAPFQWAGMISLEEAMEKFRFLRSRLKMPGVQFKWQHPASSHLEALFSRGDRRMAPLLVRAWEKGCVLDGWSDYFKQHLWDQAIVEEGLDVDFFVSRQRSLDEPLPWDVMDIRVAKDFLKEEWKKAFAMTMTPDCREGACSGCGICDFDSIEPRLFPHAAAEKVLPPRKPQHFRDLSVAFEKTGPARFFGHLEMIQILLKALRMAGVTFKFSSGFNPKPEIRFGDTLPLGMVSFCERFTLTAGAEVATAGFADRVNPFLPQGLSITACREARPGEKDASVLYYDVRGTGIFHDDKLAAFAAEKEWILEKTGKKGKVSFLDIKQFIVHMDRTDEQTLSLSLRALEGRTLRPAQVLMAVFGMTPEAIRDLEIVKVYAV
ncbi:TIGR03960 family B12-binding radical SAM protein [Desulfobotulus sp. H1]|uniref:TIGR03960 family B12-binding radical SAM protein n=1 Tax=Desulfobotulus pelophilus TaxID=2823377 RepID=A0ABT3NBG1_9BACT|nr:TIGR03960 family B12-binding radical SAM protein [Desulfobotulus pelophilus]MCW7754807.1 TIGR03960 family B12-binding radical SAM protein [Desulfobotulus pelophilus]